MTRPKHVSGGMRYCVKSCLMVGASMFALMSRTPDAIANPTWNFSYDGQTAQSWTAPNSGNYEVIGVGGTGGTGGGGYYAATDDSGFFSSITPAGGVGNPGASIMGYFDLTGGSTYLVYVGGPGAQGYGDFYGHNAGGAGGWGFANGGSGSVGGTILNFGGDPDLAGYAGGQGGGGGSTAFVSELLNTLLLEAQGGNGGPGTYNDNVNQNGGGINLGDPSNLLATAGGLEIIQLSTNQAPPPSVPEPGSAAVLGAGLAGACLFWRRRGRAMGGNLRRS